MNFLTMLFLLSGMLFVTQKSDAQCNSESISFTQGANRDNFGSYTIGELHWINSILQQSNSRYIEGMSTMQRVVFDNLPSCGGNHVLRIKMESRKGDIHAYDFLTSWDNALKAAAEIAPGFGLMPANRSDPKLHECDEAIGACEEDVCNLVTGGGDGVGTGDDFRDLPIIFSNYADPTGPGEKNLLIEGPPADQNTTRQVIETYECRYGDNIVIPSGVNAGEYDRSVRVYVDGAFLGANGDANNAVYFVGYGDANPNDGGDTYIYYDIKWSSTSSSVVLEFAAHIAVGVDGLANVNPNNCNVTSLGVGYLLNRGASSISGGPYHVIIEDFQDAPGNTPNCEGNLGNQDNQLQGSEILLIPDCDLTGPSAVCGNATATYNAVVTNPDNADQTKANNSTFLWQIINTGAQAPAASIIGSPSGIVPQVPVGQTSVPLSITVNTGGVGTYTVKLTITNGSATTSTADDISSSCTVTTTVSGGPNITCPTSTATAACQTQAQVDAAYQAWLLLASGGGTITHNGGSVGPNRCGGATTVIFTATNTCGTATCSATFTVTADNTPPGITTGGTTTTLGCNPSAGDINNALGTATATDNCGSATVTSSDGSVTSTSCGRSQTRTFTARDACNNTSTASRTVTWTADVTPPVISTSGGSCALGCNPSAGDISACLGSATATDACGTPTVTSSDGTISSDGCNRSQTRTFTARDFCGNTSTASRTANWVADVTGPVITTGGGSLTLGCNPSAGDINTSLGTATATDACGVPTVSSSDGTVTSTGCGRSQTRTFTARDFCGNTSTASRTVTWTADLTPPVITTGGGSLTLGCNPSAGDINNSLGTATATDACGVPTVSSSDGTVTSDGCSRSQTRTFTARDFCGNTATAARTVTWIADVTPPVITTGGGSLTLGCNPSAGQIEASLGTATATDNCGVPTLTSSDGSVITTSCGRSQTRTWTARDFCGNTSTASRTVSWSADNTPPGLVTTGGSCALGCNPSAADISACLGSATTSDACGSPTITSSDGTVSSDGCNRSQTRTFNAIDACGNTSSASRTANWVADLTPPVITAGGGSLTLGCNPSAGDINTSLGTATATDACGVPTVSSSDGTVTSTGCGRSQTRTFTARDFCGNTSTTSRTVTWTADLTAPVITTGGGSLTLGCNPSAGDINNSLGTATATDACGVPTVSSSDGTVTSDGCSRSQTRTFTARDFCGNTATAARTVTWIVDLTPPVITAGGGSLTLGCNPSAGDINTSLGTATATDACGVPTVSSSDGTVTSTGCGRSQTRTFTARDFCGNTSTTSRTVTWTADVTPPVITTGGGSQTLGCNPSAGDINNSLGTATATDACGVPTVSSSDGSVTSDGCNRSQTRTFTARDFCGNTSTASRTVTWIADLTPPVITAGGGSLTLGCNPSAGDINTSLGTATATDACGVPTVSSSDGTVTSTGCNRSQTRTFTARDFCGNTSTASRTVTWIADLTAPTITCAASFTAECGATATFATPTATDNCGGTPTVTAVGDVVVAGTCPTTYTKTWRARDACGNTSTCSQTISVPCCAALCTYTQGKYGQDQDISDACDGTTSSNNPYSPSELIEHDLLAYGGLMRIGCVGHSVTIATGQASCVLAMLPGGGASGPLAAGDFSICALPASYLKNGRINNALLAQTITLGLNLGINPPTLGNFALQPNKWLVTADLVECGSTTVKACEYSCTPNLAVPGTYIWSVSKTPYHVSDCRITQAVYDALTTKNVAGLFALANSALCGNALPAGVSYSDITNAVDCINNAFDECRAFIEWRSGDRPSANSFCPLPSSSTPCPAPVTRIGTRPMNEVTVTGLSVSAYPNPFSDKVSFVINSEVSGQGSLEIYNMLGQRIQTVYNGHVAANRPQLVEYRVSNAFNGGLIYIFKQGGKQVSGKLLNIE